MLLYERREQKITYQKGEIIMWICRQWTEKNGEWTSQFDSFETEKEAKEYGRYFLKNICKDDTAREYEIYRSGK